MDTDEIVRVGDTPKITGLCDRMHRILEKKGAFPARFKLTPDGRAAGHSKAEVMEWIRQRRESRGETAA